MRTEIDIILDSVCNALMVGDYTDCTASDSIAYTFNDEMIALELPYRIDRSTQRVFEHTKIGEA